MKYEHHIIYKRGALNWLTASDLDHMANANGWLLVTVTQAMIFSGNIPSVVK